MRGKNSLCLAVLARCGVLLAATNIVMMTKTTTSRNNNSMMNGEDKENSNNDGIPVQQDTAVFVRSTIKTLAEEAKKLQEKTTSSSSKIALSNQDRQKLEEVMKTVADLMNL